MRKKVFNQVISIYKKTPMSAVDRKMAIATLLRLETKKTDLPALIEEFYMETVLVETATKAEKLWHENQDLKDRLDAITNGGA